MSETDKYFEPYKFTEMYRQDLLHLIESRHPVDLVKKYYICDLTFSTTTKKYNIKWRKRAKRLTDEEYMKLYRSKRLHHDTNVFGI